MLATLTDFLAALSDFVSVSWRHDRRAFPYKPAIDEAPTDDHCECCGQYLVQATHDGPLNFTLIGECPKPDGSGWT